jgi:hypothetical protein
MITTVKTCFQYAKTDKCKSDSFNHSDKHFAQRQNSKIGGGGIGGHGMMNSLTLLQFPKQSSCELPM